MLKEGKWYVYRNLWCGDHFSTSLHYVHESAFKHEPIRPVYCINVKFKQEANR